MTYFAAVGIKQIQTYLARSRHLWGRRGASDMLAYLTSTEGFDIPREERDFRFAGEVLKDFPGVEFNRDAVDVDSVLNICGEHEAEVRNAAKALALNIKLHLPAAHVQTTLREADSYSGVIRDEDENRRAEVIDYPPNRIEFPLAHHCDECSSGMAAREEKTPEGDKRLCPDCWSRVPNDRRNEALSKAKRQSQVGFLVEQVMLRDLGLKQAKNFLDLASLGDLQGRGRRTSTDNHVATIFADGNGFGKLFRGLRAEAAKSADGLAQLGEVSKAVKKATEEALKSAILHIGRDDDATMPAIPHILGGDDILVTVPATRAWPFLIHFLEHLERAAAEGTFDPQPAPAAASQRPDLDGAGKKADNRPRSAGISFSAGMVICKQAFPIGDQVELAAALLRSAKEAVRGNGWSYAWLDVTNEGPTIPERVYDLEDWKGLSELISLASQVGSKAPGEAQTSNNAARSAIRQELAIPDPRLRTEHLRHLADRMDGAKDLFDRAFGSEWRHSIVSNSRIQDLQAVLNIMRWHA